MSGITDVIRGALKLDNFLEGKCFESWDDFVKAIPNMFTIEVPGSITNVTVGNEQPTDDERDNLWIRKDTSGSFMGLYLYAQGAWQQIYPLPHQLFRITGDSRHPPVGFTLATDDTNLSSSIRAFLPGTWHVGGTTPTWYDVFEVTYTGF